MDKINSERIWIKIIKMGGPIIALGVIYMRPDSLMSRQSNECLTNLLVRKFQEEGCNILMVGDFNGHTLTGKGGKRTAVDNNGTNLLKIVNTGKLVVANDSEKCTGIWTWICVVRNLGVLFDAKFCFTNHVNSVIKSCFISLRDLHRIRRFLSVDTSVVIANALVSSRLDYCNSLFRILSSRNTTRLQYVQNALARFVTGASKYTHITSTLRTLHWLP